MEKKTKGKIATINTRNRKNLNSSTLDLSSLYQELSQSDTEREGSILSSNSIRTTSMNSFSDLKIIKHFLLEQVLSDKAKNRSVFTHTKRMSITKRNESIIDKIEKIKLKVLKRVNLKIEKIVKYPSTVADICSYVNNEEMINLYHANKMVHNALKRYLEEQCIKFIIEPFEKAFHQKIAIENKKIQIAKPHSKNMFSKLILKCKILKGIAPYSTEENSNNNYTISLQNVSSWEKNKKDLVRNVYKFDLYPNSGENIIEHNSYWIYQERTSFNYNTINQPYQMPILPFDINDYFIISINLISSLGFIDFSSFQWKPLRLKQIDPKSKKEMSRVCEVELMKGTWQDMKSALTPQIVINEVEKIKSFTNNYLKIDDIKWDNVGYYIIRVKCRAEKVGTVYNNNEIWVDIAHKTDMICNEIKKNGLIYDNYEEGNGLQVRIGDEVVLYFSISGTQKNMCNNII